jgi:hypothetical protein
MHWDVVEVVPAENRTLVVKFADGLSGTIRLDPAYCTGVFGALLDDKLLEQAYVRNGGVTWSNGLDLAPETMYEEISQSPTGYYEVGRYAARTSGSGRRAEKGLGSRSCES